MRGYTLIETIAVITIFTVLAFTLCILFINFLSLYQNDLANPAYDAQLVTSEAERLILQASSVLSSHAFASGTYTTDAHTLVLQLPSIDSSGRTISGKYDYAVFYTSGSAAYRLLETDPASARRAGTKYLSGLVTSLTFTGYASPDITQTTNVDVDVMTARTVRMQTNSSHVNENIYLRNV